jgi:hypothetical protein
MDGESKFWVKVYEGPIQTTSIAETREAIRTYVNRENHPHPFRKETFDVKDWETSPEFRKVSNG